MTIIGNHMKKFEDLVFRQHRIGMDYPEDMEDFMGFKNAVHARMEFDNGRTISVVGGGPLYGDGVDTFEVMDYEGEVWGYLSKHEVTNLMLKTQGMVGIGEIKKLKLT